MTARDRALELLWKAQLASAGVTVTYTQGLDEVEIEAVPARTVADLDLGDGVIRTAKVADFILRSADLAVDSVPLTPEPGDRIVYANAVYEVMSLGGAQHVEPIGMSQALIRVHTKEVADV